MTGWVIGAVLAAVIVAAVLAVRRVPAAETHIVSRLGHSHRTLRPGWHLILPLIDRIAHRVSMSGRVMQVMFDDLITEDSDAVTAKGVVYFQVLDVDKAAGRIGELDDAARNLAEATTREFVKDMPLDALRKRTPMEINAWLLGLLNESAEEWGMRITRVELDFREPASDESG